jgi:hypothetical protein
MTQAVEVCELARRNRLVVVRQLRTAEIQNCGEKDDEHD